MARPTKLTPKVREAICSALSAGSYFEQAVIHGGVSKVTGYSWLKRGSKERERLEKSSRAKPRKAERKFLEFLNAVEKAQAGSDIRMVALISKAAETQWQAAAWRLERKNPDQWGRKVRQDIRQEVTLHEFAAADPGGPGQRDVSQSEMDDATSEGRAPVNAFNVPPEPNVSS